MTNNEEVVQNIMKLLKILFISLGEIFLVKWVKGYATFSAFRETTFKNYLREELGAKSTSKFLRSFSALLVSSQGMRVQQPVP